MTHNRMTIEEYIESLRGALRVAQDFINTHNVTYMGEEYEDQRRIQFNAREFVRHNQIQATLDLKIPPATLRPMSEAPVNTQLLEALKYMEKNLVKSDYSGDCIHCGGSSQCKPSCPLFHMKAAIQAAEGKS